MRDYDPLTGSYTQPDPLGLIDGPAVYRYALGSPMRYIDPSGEAVSTLLPSELPAGPSGENGDGCGEIAILRCIRNNFAAAWMKACAKLLNENDPYPTATSAADRRNQG